MERKNGKKLWIRGLVLCAAIGMIVAAKVKGTEDEPETEEVDVSQ